MTHRELLTHKAAHSDAIWSTHWVNDNTLVTAGVDEVLKVWSCTSNATLTCTHIISAQHMFVPPFPSPLPPSLTLAILSVISVNEGKWLVASAMDGCIRVYDLEKGVFLRKIEPGPLETWTLTAHPSPSSTHFLTGTRNGTCHIYDAATGEKKGTLEGEKSEDKGRWVMQQAWSSDAGLVATGHYDGKITLFTLASSGDAYTSISHKPLTPHTKAVRSLCFTPDSKQLYTVSDDMHVHVYETVHGAAVYDVTAHHSWILSCAHSSTAPYYITSSSDKKVKVWSTVTRECAYTYENDSTVWCVSVNNKGDVVALGGENGSIKLVQIPAV